jgi:hypothetical protein
LSWNWEAANLTSSAMCSADNAHANDLSISVIVDIMLGENAFNPDIMASHSSESSHGIGKDSNEPGLLRNELNQAYLSVYDDRNQESLPIILDRVWRNSSGQRWRFVNCQLINDHGQGNV